MTMSATTLKSELISEIQNFDTESAAIEGWAEAFTTYFEDAETAPTGVPVSVSALRGGGSPKDAMKAAMTGLSVTGAVAIQAGVIAFWVPINTTPATYFTGMTTPSTPPAGLTGLAAILATTFATNTSLAKSKADSLEAIADDIHAANAGGTVWNPGPPAAETIV